MKHHDLLNPQVTFSEIPHWSRTSFSLESKWVTITHFRVFSEDLDKTTFSITGIQVAKFAKKMLTIKSDFMSLWFHKYNLERFPFGLQWSKDYLDWFFKNTTESVILTVMSLWSLKCNLEKQKPSGSGLKHIK